MAQILFVNGPNLNMLKIRETEHYGTQSLEELNAELTAWADQAGVEVEFFQSNHEGELVDKTQNAYQKADFIFINAGAYTHYSIDIHGALKTVQIPFIEVHLSNIYAREDFRAQSLFSPLAAGGIFGLGALGYKLALKAAGEILKESAKERKQGEP